MDRITFRNKQGRAILLLMWTPEGLKWSAPPGYPQRAWSAEADEIEESDPCLYIAFPLRPHVG